MEIVIDTSAIIAVLVNEAERAVLIRLTRGAALLAPGSVHWEVGNALSALVKRGRATSTQAQRALNAYAAIPIRLVDVDLIASVELAAEKATYAHDAYVITCALAHRAPLLTLDRAMASLATKAGVTCLEVR